MAGENEVVIQPADQVGQDILGSARGYKSHFTRELNALKRTIQMAEDHPGSSSVAALQDRMKKLEVAKGKVEKKYEMLMEHEPALGDGVLAALDELESRFLTIQANVFATISSINTPAQVPIAAAPVNNASSNTNQHSKIRKEIMPEKLSYEANPSEMRVWAAQFKGFYDISDLKNESVLNQQLFFFKCVDTKLDSTLRMSIDESTPIFGSGSCMEILVDWFKVTHPVFTRRIEFWRYNQQMGQLFSEWVANLRLRGEEADLDKMTVDEIYVHRIVEGCVDLELKNRLLKLKKPTMADITEEAAAYEIACKTIKSCSTPGTRLNRVGGDKTRYRCGKCGFHGHADKKECPAYRKECHNCGKVGHFHKAKNGKVLCWNDRGHSFDDKDSTRSSRSSSSSSGSSDESSRSPKRSPKRWRSPGPDGRRQGASSKRVICRALTVSTHEHPNKKVPTFEAQVMSKAGTIFKQQCIPDTATTGNIISQNVLRDHGITKVDPSQGWTIKQANGRYLKTTGFIELEIYNYKARRSKRMRFLITPDLKDKVLIAWHHHQDLGLQNLLVAPKFALRGSGQWKGDTASKCIK